MVRPYSTTGPNAKKKMTESTRWYKIIARIDKRVVILCFALNCMHMYAMVQETQVTKNCSATIAAEYQVTFR